MSGDYSRFNFKYNNNYTSVFKQQGRVDLDSDWNEQAEINDRRWRSESLDVFGGEHGQGIVPETTPDAFKIVPTAPGEIEIIPGRIYVDGIQVEYEGNKRKEQNKELDARLGELRSNLPFRFDQQPFLPSSFVSNLTGTPGTTDLLYMEVWQREVTVIEDPDFMEQALGGPDTTTRMQTVWQIRAKTDVGAHQCDDPLDIWDELIKPSAGRLSVRVNRPDETDDPCIIEKAGGYGGLENTLYRVEIHKQGGLGTASFKWAKHNISITSLVESLKSDKEIIVQQLGKDSVNQFAIGDWIEILDDDCEFRDSVGHLAEVTNVDQASRTIEFTPAIDTTVYDPTDLDRHTRVRRWDQKDNADASGSIPIPADGSAVTLSSDGIELVFTVKPDGGAFKQGDYWLFHARTIDGSVQKMSSAPPRGTLRHYCKLAYVNWGNTLETSTVTDCRIHWPPKGGQGCCTFVLYPGDDIQKAIDNLPKKGGCICLKPGLYEIDNWLDINRSNVYLKGESAAAIIKSNNGQNLINISPATKVVSNVVIDGISLQLTGGAHTHLACIVYISLGRDVRIINCRIHGDTQTNIAGIAIDYMGAGHSNASKNITISKNSITAGFGIVAMMQNPKPYDSYLNIQNNLIVSNYEGIETDYGIGLYYNNAKSTISNNQIEGFRTAIAELGGYCEINIEKNIIKSHKQYNVSQQSANYVIDITDSHCNIIDNYIELLESGIHIGQAGVSSCIENNTLFGIHNDIFNTSMIDVESQRCVIRDNKLFANDSNRYGIRISGDGTFVENNHIRGLFEENNNTVVGIHVFQSDSSFHHCKDVMVSRNIISMFLTGIELEGTERVQLVKNIIDSVQNTHSNEPKTFGIFGYVSRNSYIENNKIEFCDAGVYFAYSGHDYVVANHVSDGLWGIVNTLSIYPIELENNYIENMRKQGITNISASDVNLYKNKLVNCGFEYEEGGLFNSAVIVIADANIQMESCEVLDTGAMAENAIGVVVASEGKTVLCDNTINYRNLLDDAKTRPPLLAVSSDDLVINRNIMVGPNPYSLLVVASDKDVDFSHNICEHRYEVGVDPQDLASVMLHGTRLNVVGNNIKGVDDKYPSVDLSRSSGEEKSAMFISNMTTGSVKNTDDYPSPEYDFNLIPH